MKAVKDPTPGSGLLTLELKEPPPELPIANGYPWYAEFRLFELAKNGSRVREVRFEGDATIVATRPRASETGTSSSSGELEAISSASLPFEAIGRVEIQSPQPWGYEAEVVKWFGVAPKSRLVTPASSRSGGSARPRPKPAAESIPTSETAPSTPPLEEAPQRPLPAEPETPGVPAFSS